MTTRTSARTQSTVKGFFHLTDYLRIIYRRRWTASLAVLVVFVYGAFGTLRKTPIYETATTLMLELDRRSSNSLDSVLDKGATYFSDEDAFQTQFRVLQSRQLAWTVVQRLGLKPSAVVPPTTTEPGLYDSAKNWVMNAVGAPKKIAPPPADETTAQASLVGGFLSGLSVTPVRRTFLVELRYRSADPEFAARAANELALAYIEQTVQSRFSDSKATTEFLTQQLEEYRVKMQESQKKLRDYQETNNAVGVDDQTNVITQTQSDLNAKLIAAKGDRLDKELLFKRVEALVGANDQDGLATLPAVASNDFVSELRTSLNEMRQRRVKMATSLRPGEPRMVQVDNEIQTAEKKLQTEIDKTVDRIRVDYAEAQGREERYQQMLDSNKREGMQLGRKGVAYAALKEEAESNRQLYEMLLNKAKESGVSGDFKGTMIRVIDKAEVPRAPSSPNTRRELMTALLTGLFVGVVLAFGFEYLDSRIRTPEEIKTHLGLSFLGLVPALSEKDLQGGAALITENVPATFSEAVRGVRTAVMFSSAEEGARTVVVTSTAPSEGKTLVSTNLAVALAQAEQRTLIIDGDMRRPRVHEVFDRLQEPGLSNVLVGTTELPAAVCRTSVPNLFVLSAGHIPPNPAELLGSSRYRELMRDLRNQFDWIIVDAPPVMAVTDATIVASSATGVVFVIGSEMTSRRQAAFAIEQLAAVKAHFIGAVLNRADVQRHGYYYSTYYRKDYTQAYTRSS